MPNITEYVTDHNIGCIKGWSHRLDFFTIDIINKTQPYKHI